MKSIFISVLCVLFLAGTANAAFDRKSKVSQNDSTAAYLNGKLTAGSNVNIVEQNDGGNESLEISAVTVGSGLILDLGNDASNESTALTKITTVNDTNSIASEPNADELRFDMSQNWPSSDTASALSANGANCATGLSPEGVDASGAVENCIDPILESELTSEASLETQIGVDVFTTNDGALNDDDVTNNTLGQLQDVTETSLVADQILIRNTGNTAYINKSIPDCDNASVDKLAYDVTTQAFTCITDQNTSGVGYTTVQDEATPLTARGSLNMIGAAVSCVDNAGSGRTDCTFTGGGAAQIFDIGDDGGNDSTNLAEIATVNDTNAIITLAAADKMLIDMSQNWPTADAATSASTATALAANGANCSANNYPLGVDASGAVEGCTADDDVPEVGDFDAFVGGNYSTYDTGTDQLNVDDEVVTGLASFTLFDPTTADTNKIQHKFATAVTLSRVSCSTDVGTVTMQFDERVEGTPNTAGTDVMTSAIVCSTTTASTTSFTNAGIAADAPFNVQITATASTPTVVRVHLDGKKDDI